MGNSQQGSMSSVEEGLRQVRSMEELEGLAKELPELVKRVAESQDAELRAVLGKGIKAVKARVHPVQQDGEVAALFASWEGAPADRRQELAALHVRRCNELMDSPEGRRYTRAADAIDRAIAPLLQLDHGTGRSNRARRAKAASCVFSAHAGLSRIAGAHVDRDGNAVGEEYDLGLRGAYDGLRVVILQQYTEPSFDCARPIAALRAKGFEVDHHRGTTPTVAALRSALAEASQVWLISGSQIMLSKEHINVIIEAWQDGLGVYVYGDNDPFYKDANRLLAAMFPKESLELAGNRPGGQQVSQATASGAAGFVPHLLTTGLASLFEGITVATLKKKAAVSAGFEEVLRDHEGNLIVVARGGTKCEGPVIVDCAFTKLYCHWDIGGSARFVRNCACWLSTVADRALIEAEQEQQEVEEEKQLDLRGAFCGECSITLENGPLALLAAEPADPEVNTTDFALDNNLALGARNMVLCPQPMGLATAKAFLQQGQDPFSRRPVACVVPLVSLEAPQNLRAVTEVACQLFMGGRPMGRHALNILLSVCEEMLDRQPDSPEALRFLIGEILRHAPSTPDMLKGVPGGPTVALMEGMTNNVMQTGDLVPYRKVVTHVARIVRLLAGCGRVPQPELLRIARRSLLKTVVGAAARVGKEDGGDGAKLLQMLDGLLFDTVYGIPIAGTAQTRAFADVKGLIAAGVEHVTPAAMDVDQRRTAAALGVEELLPPEHVTAALVELRGRGVGAWRVMVEPLLRELCTRGTFREMWDADRQQEPTGAGARAAAEQQLSGRFFVEPEDHARYPWPGFVSPQGPSVYRCKCGVTFGDPTQELDDERAEAIRSCRNAHFAKAFAADTNGYPTATSTHFPLHRATQSVLCSEEYRRQMERTQAMEEAVAAYLRKRGKGNIHTPTLRGDIAFAIDTYLDCRRRGMEEPSASCRIGFLDRARVERALILASRAAGQGDWVDPARPYCP
eukprot:Hpha_TRINITY_DN15675_c0_g7::TRINITY_DN15675_c0_g7_i1::g.98805::m.98805